MSNKKTSSVLHAFAAANPGEPVFVLLGRDPQAADLVRIWATGRDFLEGSEDPKIEAARKCAAAMQGWCINQTEAVPVEALTLLPFAALASELRRRGATVTADAGNVEFGDLLDLDS